MRRPIGRGTITLALLALSVAVAPYWQAEARAQDTTPPSAPGVPNEGSAKTDVDYSSTHKFKVAWARALDAESGIAVYEVQEQTGESGPWITLSSTVTSRSLSISGRTHGVFYSYRIRARNGAGLWGPFSASSDGILIDLTRPTSLTPITDDGSSTNQLSELQVSWTPSTDPESGVARYEVRLRDTTTKAVVRDWTPAGTAAETMLGGLDLVVGHTYRVSVRARNGAGAYSATGNSDGIKVFDPGIVPAQPSQVSIAGRQLIVRRRGPDGTLGPPMPYAARIVNWTPAGVTTNTSPTDIDNVLKRRPEFGYWYETDVPLMKGMNVNTVRLFMDPGLPGDPGVTVPGLQILDELYRRRIMVIMTVDNGNNTVARILPVIAHYKNHPAILMWSLASEFNVNRFWKHGEFPTVDSAAAAIESAAQLVKGADTTHPVAASYGSIVDKPNDIARYVNQVCPSVDVWSFNEYRGPGFARMFDQWAFISAKPMFIGEFGIDAYDSVAGVVDEPTHAAWLGSLWDDIARNLSATVAGGVAIGGAVFSLSDEWWKTPPPHSQDTGGWAPIAFPDRFASEDYWGVLTIERAARSAYGTLSARFVPGYQPPSVTEIAYRAESLSLPQDRGRFWESGALSYDGLHTLNGARGFNVAAVDRTTGRLVAPIQSFDTWGSRHTGAAMNALVTLLDSLADGTLVLIVVVDEAGLNEFDSCALLPAGSHPWLNTLRARLASLGSTRIDDYCYRDQWSMIAVKGQGALAESHGSDAVDAVAEATLPLP